VKVVVLILIMLDHATNRVCDIFHFGHILKGLCLKHTGRLLWMKLWL